jgi:TetR/AcrR family transcriptional regulator, cholesterol catabolism regulator
VNARLYPPGNEQVNDRDHVVAIFSAAFANEPDLADYSPAAHRVLSTSAALFLERGAANTSVRHLTRACGLSPGALYNHFPSKDELLFTIVRHGHDRMRRRIDEALDPAPTDPVAGFRAYVTAYVTGHVRQPELAQLSRQEYLHLSPGHCAEIVELRRGMRRTLSALIHRGEQAGHFRVLGDVVGQTLMVLDMCSRTSDWYDRSRESDEHEIAARYVQGALRLVGAT